MYYLFCSIVYFLKVIHIYHFLVYLAYYYFISFTHMYIYIYIYLNHVVSPRQLRLHVTQEAPLPSCIFNHSCHIEDNVQHGWGGRELRKEVFLLMLSYFDNLVDFCLILKFFKFLLYSLWLLRKNSQNEKREIEFLSSYLT